MHLRTDSRRPSVICWIANVCGLTSAVVTFSLGVRTANIEGTADLAFGLGFAFWSGLPFFMLGAAKVLRHSVGLLTVLLLLGLG